MRVLGKLVSSKSDGSCKDSPSAGTPPAPAPLTLSNTPPEKTLPDTTAAGMEKRQEPSPTGQQLPPPVADWVLPAPRGSSAASAAAAERVAPPTAHRVGSRGPASALPPTTRFTPNPSDPPPAPVRPSRPRLEERIASQMASPTSSWSVAEVCDWLEAFGMGQYRKRFVHNAVSGSVLLRLTDQRLRADLGMGSLGHRESLLRAVAELQQRAPLGAPLDGSTRAMAPSALGPPSLPAAAPVPVAAVKAQEQQARLLKELSKAKVKAAQRRAAAEQASRTVELAEQEVQRVQDALAGVASRGGGLSNGGQAAAVDFRGTPVWFPAGRVAPTVSKKAMAGAKPAEAVRAEQCAGVSFLDRLEADLAARQAKRDQEANGRHAPAPAESIAEAEAAALSFVKELFADRDATLLEALGSGSAQRAAAALDAAAAQLAADMGLPEKQLDAVKAAKGAAAKAVRLAAAVRTSQFMQRLGQDLTARQGRAKEVQQKWRAHEAATAAAHEARDAAEAKARFEALGWPGEMLAGAGGADELLGALLRRATALQQAKQAGKPVEWEPFRTDGLLSMQPAASAPAPAPTLPPAAGGERAVQATASPPPAVVAAAGPTAPPAGGSAALLEVVELLAACRADELHRLEGMAGPRKMVAVHRSLRAQAFIRFTRAVLASKAAKRKEALAAGKPPRKIVPKEQQEQFLQRLMEDAARRTKNRGELAAKAEAVFMTVNQKQAAGGKGKEGGAKKA